MSRISKKIRDMRLAAGLNQEEFGRALGGVPQSTVSKWEKDIQKPTFEHVAKLAGLAGITPEEFYGIPSATSANPSVRTVTVIGNLQAGDWREAIEWPEDDRYEVPAPTTRRLKDMELVAWEVTGPSMNKVYPDGSVVYAAPIATLGRMPVSGERVVVQRVDASGMYEATVKEFVVADDGKPWLWPRSDDPEHQAPIQYVDRKRRIEHVSIVAIVMAAIIVEPSARA